MKNGDDHSEIHVKNHRPPSLGLSCKLVTPIQCSTSQLTRASSKTEARSVSLNEARSVSLNETAPRLLAETAPGPLDVTAPRLLAETAPRLLAGDRTRALSARLHDPRNRLVSSLKRSFLMSPKRAPSPQNLKKHVTFDSNLIKGPSADTKKRAPAALKVRNSLVDTFPVLTY